MYSPTVGTDSFFTVLAIAASEQRHIAALDVEGAYLEADMIGDPVHMRLNSEQANILIEENASFKKFQNTDGSVIVQLDKALYGCIESAKLWYNHLSNILRGLGYVENPTDPCVFNKTVRNSQLTIIIYVDDVLLTHKDPQVLIDAQTAIRREFTAIKTQNGSKLRFLGVDINRSAPGNIFISMGQYTRGIRPAPYCHRLRRLLLTLYYQIHLRILPCVQRLNQHCSIPSVLSYYISQLGRALIYF